MRRKRASLSLVALVAVATVLAIGIPSQATTVPIPRGVVVGIEANTTRCFEEHCDMYTNFRHVQIIGRLRGLQVIASATQMQYLSQQFFCPFNCPPTTPTLTKSFTISGTTAAGAPFAGTCTSGSIQQAFPDEGIYAPLVTARSQGCTPTSQGGFALKFLHPAWALISEGPSSVPFVGILVEA